MGLVVGISGHEHETWPGRAQEVHVREYSCKSSQSLDRMTTGADFLSISSHQPETWSGGRRFHLGLFLDSLLCLVYKLPAVFIN